jgi:hypothetical protein
MRQILKLKDMKNIIYKINRLGVLVMSALVFAVACDKDEDKEFKLSRQFSPATIETLNGETQVALGWAPSLFTLPGEVEYIVEVSKDPTFSTIDYAATTTEAILVITDESLAIKQDYVARIKAVGKDGSTDSNWTMSGVFRITGEQFLQPVPGTDISDVGVILRWRPNSSLTKIVLTPAGGTPVEVSLAASDHVSSQKTVMSLSQNTVYTAEIFQDTKTKGIISFKTQASITGANIIDLTGTTGNPGALVSALGTAPSGSVIILRRGETYTLASTFSFSKSVTIRTGLGFGTNLATLRSSASFNVTAGSNIDSLVFKDLIIRGGRATSYDADYLMNVNAACVVTKVRLDNCIVKILRGVVRGQATGAGAKFGSYFVNNCVLDSIRDFAVAAANNTSAFANIRITNSTIYKARKFIILSTTGTPASVNNSIVIENTTFNDAPGGAALATTNFLIDLNTVVSTNGITIRNSIIGRVWNEAGTLASAMRAPNGTAVVIANTYSTSDFTATSAIPGLSGYSGTAAALFINPETGDFKIKDATFAGKSSAGDPRWRL